MILFDVNDLLKYLDVEEGLLDNWFEKYGVSSVDDMGVAISPGFPQLSKLFWINVNDVVLSREDIIDTLYEIDKLSGKHNLPIESHPMYSIASLGKEALNNEEGLAFSHS